ncbi:MAG: YhgE/Pip domain-containing protein [Anaerovoracaceae bacterium]
MSVAKKNILKITVIIGALIIPLMYSFFYLGAFWDPYDKLDNVPMAIVNLDSGSKINGDQRNLGQEICDNLKEDGSLNFIFTDAKDAKSGVAGDKYYASLTIPTDFSAQVATASKKEKIPATIIYSVNEKRNYLGAQILNTAIAKIEKEITSNIDKEIVVSLSDKLEEVPDALKTLEDGFIQLSSGAERLKGGAVTLQQGVSQLQTGIGKLGIGANRLKEGTSRLKTGTDKLKKGNGALTSGVQDLNDALTQLQSGINEINKKTKDVGKLADGTKSLSKGASDLNSGLKVYTSGVDQTIGTLETSVKLLAGSYGQLTDGPLKQQVGKFLQAANTPQNQQNLAILKASGPKLQAGSKEISSGADQLYAATDNLPALKTGLTQLGQGVSSAKDGSSALAIGSVQLGNGIDQVATGATALNSGATELSNGTGKLEAGAAKVAHGTNQLGTGIDQLSRGIAKGKKGVTTSIKDTKKQLTALYGLDQYAATPIYQDTQTIEHIPNYGTAFAPYFLSLSLWVGGLIIFFGIYLDVDKRYKYLCRDSKNVVLRSVVYLALGLAQATILAMVIKFALGLQVAHFTAYILGCCLVSMVFISIIQFCLVHLKDLGKFVALLLLILQLTSCGGTFPIETVPKIFQVLYPFMPMTYSVGLFREVIGGSLGYFFKQDLFILIGILVVFVTTTILLSVMKKEVRIVRQKKRIEKKRLERSLNA